MTEEIGTFVVVIAIFAFSVFTGSRMMRGLVVQKVVFALSGGFAITTAFLLSIGVVDGRIPANLGLVAFVLMLGSVGWICVSYWRTRSMLRALVKQAEVQESQEHPRRRPDQRKRLTCPSCAWAFTMGTQDFEARSRLPCPACGSFHEVGAYDVASASRS